MNWKILVASLTLSVGLSAPSFGFELLSRILGTSPNYPYKRGCLHPAPALPPVVGCAPVPYPGAPYGVHPAGPYGVHPGHPGIAHPVMQRHYHHGYFMGPAHGHWGPHHPAAHGPGLGPIGGLGHGPLLGPGPLSHGPGPACGCKRRPACGCAPRPTCGCAPRPTCGCAPACGCNHGFGHGPGHISFDAAHDAHMAPAVLDGTSEPPAEVLPPGNGTNPFQDDPAAAPATSANSTSRALRNVLKVRKVAASSGPVVDPSLFTPTRRYSVQATTATVDLNTP